MNDYTAITTKTRALRSKLLSHDYIQNEQNLNSLKTIHQLLIQTEGYDQAIKDSNITPLTPGHLIPVIYNGVYYTFLKLYRFATLNQRKVLKLYGIKYESEFIKTVLNNIKKNNYSDIYFERFTSYLERNRGFDISKLQSATTVSEVIDSLNGTIYAEFFEKYRSNFQDDYYDSNLLKVKFDQFVAMYIWKKARHIFSEKEVKQFKKYYGSYIDLVNIGSIYRLKFVYKMENDQIKNYILQPSRRLTDSIIEELLQANNQIGFERILNTIGYAEVIAKEKRTNNLRIEKGEFLERLLRFLTRACRESMLPILEYLEDKQREAKLLVQTTEKIGWNKANPLERESI